MMAITLLMPNVVFASANNPQQDFTEEERESGFYSEDGYPRFRTGMSRRSWRK